MHSYSIRAASLTLALLILGAVVLCMLLRRIDTSASPDREALIRSLERGAAWASALFFVVALARMYAQLDAMRFPDESIWTSYDALTKSMWGRGWALQIAGSLIGAIAFIRAGRVPLWRDLAPIAALALTVGFAFMGHAVSVERGRNLLVAADAVHVLAGGAWLGTLAMIMLHWRRIPLHLRALVLSVFTPVALVSAALIALSGTLASWTHLGTVGALVNSAYGRLLLLKLAFVALVLAAGYTNWRRNRLRVATDGGAALQRAALVELAAAMSVVLVTAALTQTSTPIE